MAAGLLVLGVVLLVAFASARLRAKTNTKPNVQKLF
jgi:hypothetical protein